MLAFGRERADAADLNADRAEIREPAQREGGDGKRNGIETAFHWTEMRVCDEFIDHHPLTQQRADRPAVVPGYAHHKCDRPENPTEHGLDADGEPRHESMDPSEQTVQERD